MQIKIFLVISCTIFFQNLCTLICDKPLCVIHTPDSILQHKENYVPFFVGNRFRYATCTGAAWFHDHYLAILNLYGAHITTYCFDVKTNTYTFLQKISNKEGARLSNAENVTISPDGTLLIVCAAQPTGISIYYIDRDTHLIDPKPVFSLSYLSLIHNIKFLSSGTLACATFDNNNAVVFYQLVNNPIRLEYLSSMNNSSKSMKVKAIHFTKDNNYIIIARSYNVVSYDVNKKLKCSLTVYTFDKKYNTIGKRISKVKNISQLPCIEDITLIKNDTMIIASNQGNDTLLLYPFNPETGQIDEQYTLIQNPEAQLSFPHGMGISSDEKYLAVTNYGDDTCNIYQIE